MWLKELKIAIIQKDIEKISQLLQNLPTGLSSDDLVQAQYLLQGAKELVLDLQNDTYASMQQMKKNIDFLNATQAPHTPKLDINS